MNRWSIVLGAIAFAACGLIPKPQPPPQNPCDQCRPDQDCVDGQCVDAPPPPVWECELEMPGCHETGQTCSEEGAPCWHNPTTNPEHCEEAPACPVEPLPQPQCEASDQCNCWRGLVKIECPEPPPAGDCPWGTPTAAQLFAEGRRVEIRPKQEGKRSFGATPLGAFGKEYYCQPGLWPEACAGGRNFGPVTPDGHPDRVACEKQYLELDGPNFTLESRGHMSMDPFIVINAVNQNHPRNVLHGLGTQFGDHYSWRKEEHNGHLYIVEGQMSWFTLHGTGRVCAAAKDNVGKACRSFTDPKE